MEYDRVVGLRVLGTGHLASVALTLALGACLSVPGSGPGDGDGVVGSRRCADLPTGSPSRVYSFEIDGEAVDHYCEMVIDGGGWTLVGRSAEGGSSIEFGWFARDGAIEDLSAPYSLGLGLDDTWVSEILLGKSTADGLSLTEKAYVLALPAGGFPAAHRTDSVEGTLTLFESKNCDNPAPSELSHAGQTMATNRFSLSDEGASTGTGLFASGFNFNDNNCSTAANLEDSTTGIIFAR
jgi:hypothetical protein